MTETAEAIPQTNSKAPVSSSGLPRLGSGHTVARKIKEVELTDAGASLLLSKPSVAAILEIQEKVDFDKATMREMYVGTVGLIASMLVDPKLSEGELRGHTDELSFADWQHLQNEALELAGMGEQARQQAEADFRGSGEG